MRDQPFHPQRRQLIEHVADDVRALHQNSAKQQKYLFSGRALADMLAGDTFESARESDAKYFTSGKVDLNKVTDVCIRYVPENGYSNGPIGITYSGFIHTNFVLPSGTLTYSDSGLATRGGNPVSARQILYPDDMIEFEAYTRVGKYNTTTKSWDWTEWITLSGRMLRILITEQDDEALQHLRPNVIYELHMGGVRVKLPSADAYPAATKIIFEQYHNGEAQFTRVNTSSVPAPNVRYFTKTQYTDALGNRKNLYTPAGTNNGWLTAFESGKEYYTQIGQASWTNLVEYSEKVLNEKKDLEERTYTTQIVPALDTIRTSSTAINSGSWYENSEQALTYVFEIVDREEAVIDNGKTSTRTWMLDVDPEAVSRMSDMAELLDQHTDPMMTDIVQYNLRKFKGAGGNSADISGDYLAYVPNNNEALVVSRPASMNGLIKFTLTGNTSRNNGESTWYRQLSDSFKVSIYVYNEASSSFNWQTAFNFTKVNKTTDPLPNQFRQYYVINPNTQQYELTGAHGYLTTFEEGRDYYTRSVTEVLLGTSLAKFKMSMDGAAEQEYSAQFLNQGSTSNTFQREAYFATHDELVGYIRAARNDTIMVVITSGNHVADMQLVTPVVEFYPDPHDSYIMKPQMANDAITEEELAAVPRPEGVEHLVARADAVVRAYKTLATHLQKKGLLFGSLPTIAQESESLNMNDMTEPGIYTVNASKSAIKADDEFLPSNSDYDGLNPDVTQRRSSMNPRHSFDSPVTGHRVSNAVLLVMRSEAYDKNVIIEPTEQSQSAFKSMLRVTQILIGNSGNRGTTPLNNVYPSIWTRFGVKSEGDTVINWSHWVQLQNSMISYNATVSNMTGGSVSESDVIKALSYGSPNIVVTGNGSTGSNRITVNLPDPALYPNAKLKIEAVNTGINIRYVKKTNNGATSTTYSYVKDLIKTAPNRAVYPIESDGEYWYVITVS